MILVVWYFVAALSPLHVGVSFLGPFPSLEVCLAAKDGAKDFGGYGECRVPEMIDEELLKRVEEDLIVDRMGEYGS